MASTLVSARQILLVGANAAASSNVWNPMDDAYSTMDRSALLFVMFEAPVTANSELQWSGGLCVCKASCESN